MNRITIGPVQGTVYNFDPQWTSDLSPKGLRTARFAGALALSQAEQLSELVANPHRRQSEAGASGVLEYILPDSLVAARFQGWYLLQSMDFLPWRIDAGTRYVTFSLSATLLPPRLRPRVAFSSRPLANAYNLPPVAMLADPLGAGFNPDPGGIPLFRAYDPRPRSRATYAPHTGTVSRDMELRVADARLS